MSSLSELYAKVCEKVPGANAFVRYVAGNWYWTPAPVRVIPEEHAEALILKHWLSLVKNYDDLCHPNGRWRMFCGMGSRTYASAATPLEALSIYLLAQVEAP